MILATRSGNVEMRDASIGALVKALDLGRGAVPLASVPVNERTVSGLPAATRTIQAAAWAVAKLTFAVYRGEDVQKRRIRTTWQSRFFAGEPAPGVTWFEVWEQTETLLTASGNAYWLKMRDTVGRVAAVMVAPRGLVVPRRRQDGTVEYVLGDRRDAPIAASEVVHFRGSGAPGELEAPSPIERHRDVLAAAIARQRHEAGFWESGTGRALAAVFPREVKATEADEYRKVYQATFGAPENHGRVRVLGGGAELTTVGLTMEEAQFVQAAELTVEETARIFGWPVYAIGGGKFDRPISPEHESQRTLEHYLVPRLTRLEQKIQGDPDWFGVGARDYPLFDSAGFVRGDVKTESDRLVHEVQSGILLADEARASRGLPPLPDGVGKIPQIVPVGGAPNPGAPAPAPAPAVPAVEQASRGREVIVPEVRVAFPEVRMETPPPTVIVNVPEQPAPVVHFTAPAQPPAEVVVNVPEQPAPIVNVEVPAPVVNVAAPKVTIAESDGPKTVTIKRDPLGRITAAEVD